MENASLIEVNKQVSVNNKIDQIAKIYSALDEFTFIEKNLCNEKSDKITCQYHFVFKKNENKIDANCTFCKTIQETSTSETILINTGKQNFEEDFCLDYSYSQNELFLLFLKNNDVKTTQGTILSKNQGVGTAVMLKLMDEYFKSYSHSSITIDEALKDARRFYENLGFIINPTFEHLATNPRIPHVKMKCIDELFSNSPIMKSINDYYEKHQY